MQRQSVKNTFRLPSFSDGALISLLGELAALEAEGTFSLNIFGRDVATYRNADEVRSGSVHRDWDVSKIINAASVRIGGIAVEVARQVSDFEAGTQAPRQSASAWECEAWVTWGSAVTPDPSLLFRVAQVLDGARGGAGVLAAAQGGVSTGPAVEVIAGQVAALSELHGKIVGDAEQLRIRREAEFEERRQAIARELQEARDRISAEAAAREEELAQRAAELARQAAELDNRGHMHARRELRTKISDDLKDRLSRPGVGGAIQESRKWIFVGGVALSFVFVAVGTASLLEFWELARYQRIGNNVVTYLVSARIALSAAAVAGVGFYLLGWARQIHDADLRADRELERYRYDIDRASWAIETILKAQVTDGARQGSEVPDEWIAGATHGLFARGEHRDDEHSATEALGALLSYAAEAEIGPAGTKFKLTPRGVRKLKRSGLLEGEE